MAASKKRALVEQKAFQEKSLAAFGLEQFLRGEWARFTIEEAGARSILEIAEKCEAIRNGRQVATRELLRHCGDLRFDGVPMCQAYNAGGEAIGITSWKILGKW